MRYCSEERGEGRGRGGKYKIHNQTPPPPPPQVSRPQVSLFIKSFQFILNIETGDWRLGSPTLSFPNN